MDYKITLSGSNVLLLVDGEVGSYGFYVNIYTSADCENAAIEEAKKLVVCRLRSNQSVQWSYENILDFVVEEVVATSPEIEHLEQGFVWYRNGN